MDEFVRVKDKVTGHEYSVRYADPEQHEVLEDEEAVDHHGEPLPAIHADKAQPAELESEQAKASELPAAPDQDPEVGKAKTSAVAPAAAKNNGGKPVEIPEEGPK